jgi:hypothetical protein
MYVDCSHEHSCRAEYADGPFRCLRLVPGVGSRDLIARRAHSDLPTPGSDGRTTLLRARRQHPDRHWWIGCCDPLLVESGHHIDRAGWVQRIRARGCRYSCRRGARLSFLRLAGRSVLEPDSSHQCLRSGAGDLYSGDSGVLGRGRERLSSSAAGSRQMGVRNPGGDHRERPVRHLPLRPTALRSTRFPWW